VETRLKPVEKLIVLSQEKAWSAAFANGYSEGEAARRRSDALTPYVRVGIDDYAKGYRAGYYGRVQQTASGLAANPLHVVGL